MSYISKEGNLRVGKIIGHVALAILALILIFGSFGTIGAGEKGVLLQFGAVQEKVFDEGLFFKVPFVQKVRHLDVKIQKEQVEVSAASKDLQTVSSVIALNYHLDENKAPGCWKTLKGELMKCFLKKVPLLRFT